MAKLTLSFKDKKLRIYPVTDEHVVIGRAPDCAIQIDSLAVEPQHASIHKEGAHYVITAMGENHAIQVNSSQAAAHELQEGDVIHVGKHTLTFSLEPTATFVGQAQAVSHGPAIGWLQIQSGSHLGRTIRLDRAMTRVGKSNKAVAVIVRRDSGYYLSHLEGDTPPLINDQPLDDRTHALRNGDRIHIGNLDLQFFIEETPGSAADTEKPEHDQRDFSRVHFEVGASLHKDDSDWDTKLTDISLHGALIQRPDNWEPEPDGIYRLDVHLDADITISMDVHVAHSNTRQVGLTCNDIDVDSITHLRRLVELNLGDASLVERELSALG